MRGRNKEIQNGSYPMICVHISRRFGQYNPGNEFPYPSLSIVQQKKVSLLVWRIGPKKPTIPSNDQIIPTSCESEKLEDTEEL